MHFKILEPIKDIEPIAVGAAIREHDRLVKVYGSGRWRKLKGITKVRLSEGTEAIAEVHWYEAHGIGKVEYKIKHILEWLT